MFDKMKELYQLQKKARAIQKELKNIEVEASALEDKIKVTFNGEQKIQNLEIDESLFEQNNKRTVEQGLLNAIREGIARSQQISAEKMKDVAGDLNIPGLS
ncbi:YbaB/EbfC family nucleoid-associated protein [Patescibacteria group bacterium]